MLSHFRSVSENPPPQPAGLVRQPHICQVPIPKPVHSSWICFAEFRLVRHNLCPPQKSPWFLRSGGSLVPSPQYQLEAEMLLCIVIHDPSCGHDLSPQRGGRTTAGSISSTTTPGRPSGKTLAPRGELFSGLVRPKILYLPANGIHVFYFFFSSFCSNSVCREIRGQIYA